MTSKYRRFFCFFIVASVLTATMAMAAERGTKNKVVTWKKNVTAGDCAACHGEKRKLPPNHPDTRKMSLAECKKCHTEQGNRLTGKLLMSHVHRLAGLACTDCHEGKKKPTAKSVPTAKCLSCHTNYEHLAALTEKVDPNPHKSHLGPIDCGNCHHQHTVSANYCGQCHSWPLDVP